MNTKTSKSENTNKNTPWMDNMAFGPKALHHTTRTLKSVDRIDEKVIQLAGKQLLNITRNSK